ncbi:MAG: uroporphyrinogen decarboxylase family protein, partial [Chloroflexota bacterium]
TVEQVSKAIRTGDPARAGKIFKTVYKDLEVREERVPGALRQTFVTPYGEVTYGQITSDYMEGRSESGLPLEHPIKKREDYKVWEYVTEHTYYEPTYDAYMQYEQQVGNEGYPMVSAGDCPFHHIQLRLVGYNDVYFHLMDYQNELDSLVKVMTDVERERLWPVVAESPARLILHGMHFDSQMTPPKLFTQYITPYYEQFTALMHAKNKRVTWHADDDSAAILEVSRDAGFDMAECFCTAPMVSVTLEEARRVFGKQCIIWGGIPSIVLEDTFPEDEFREYVKDVIRTIAPGDAMILGVADNVMPRSIIERVEYISDAIEAHGKYPIDPTKIS